MQHRPRRIREELLDHGWWLVPLVLLVWFRQLELPTPAPGPELDESWHAVKGWELLTIVRLGIDSVFTYGRLGWFHDTPDLTQLFGWKFWGFEIAFKLVLCASCGLALVRTQGKFARLVFALALLSLSAGLDALAFVALLALFQRILAQREGRARVELAWLALGTLLVQVKFTYFLLFAAGIALCFVAFWAEVSLRRASAFLLRALCTFLFVWMALGQSPLALWDWIVSSCWIASGYNQAMSAAGPRAELWLALAMLAALLGVLALGFTRGARSRALLALVLATALISWRTSFTRQIGNSDVFFCVAPLAACFALRGRASVLVCAALLVAGNWGLSHSHPQRDATLARLVGRRLALSRETLADLFDPAGLHQRISYRGGDLANHWDLPRVRERAGGQTIDVFQNSQGIALLNGLNFHPRPVFQSYSAYTPELAELNRAFYEGGRAPVFALYKSEPIDGRFAPAEDAKAFDELLLRYTPCFEERGWLLLERAPEPVRKEFAATLERRSVALGEWIEIANVPGDALELRLDAHASARGALEALLLRGPALYCEFERADGSRSRARLVPGSARAGFLVRPFLETPSAIARVFAGLPEEGLRRLRVLAAPGEEDLWEAQLGAQLVWRDGLLPPLDKRAALALEYPCFQPAPQEVVRADGPREAQQGARQVQVFPAPGAVRWHLEPGVYQLTATYGLLDSAWQTSEPSDGALVFVVLQQGREQQQLLRRLLEPASAPPDRGDQPLRLEFEVREPAELYLRMRTGWKEDAARDWIYWDHVTLERL
jgi:hypothetical protein